MHGRQSFPIFKLFVWLLFGLFLVLFVLLPTINYFIGNPAHPTTGSSVESGDQTLSEIILLYAASLFTTISFLAIGAAVGSYLNVIAYRVPRHIPLTFTRSACPSCGAPIHLSDNIPIISWCRLKGRCRACQAPISVRYPLVETSIATVFLALYFRELLSGGVNIPVRIPNHYTGVLWILFYTKWDLVGLYLLHCFMLTTILGWGLINADGFRVPRSSLLTAMSFVFTAILIWPNLIPVKLNLSLEPSLLSSDRFQALLSSFCGSVSGAVLGSFLAIIISKLWPSSVPSSNAITYSFILCGAIDGWQAMLPITLMAFAFVLTQQLCTRFLKNPVLSSPGISVFLAIFTFHFFWRQLTWY